MARTLILSLVLVALVVVSPSAHAADLSFSRPAFDDQSIASSQPLLSGLGNDGFYDINQVALLLYTPEEWAQGPSRTYRYRAFESLGFGDPRWFHTVGTPLADGRYFAEVAQRYEPTFGDDEIRRASTSFWVDTASPDTRIDSATPASPTNATTRSFTFNGTDATPSAPVALTFECKVDDGAWTACTSPFTTPTLPEGDHAFAVRAKDAAGNVDDTPATSTWMVDTTKPDITVDEPSVRERYVLDEDVDADVTCTDPLSGGPPPVASGVASCDHPAKVDTSRLGNFVFTVTARDRAGNERVKRVQYAVDPPRYADRVNATGPIAFYRLGDPIGSPTMRDSSGNGRDATSFNDVAFGRRGAIACQNRPHPPRACELKEDPQDFAAHFAGRDAYGARNGIVAPTRAYSIDAWIKPDKAGSLSIAGQGGAGQLFLQDGRLALRQTQDTVVAPGGPLPLDRWTYVAATWDGTNVRLYVNGSRVITQAATKPPSGSATFYVGYGDQAPWFSGDLDEVAYTGSRLSADEIFDRWQIGTAKDHPSPVVDGVQLPIAGPSADATHPANGGLYAPTKTPELDFRCTDPDGADDLASCAATVDGAPIANGTALPDAPGEHVLRITAVDDAGLTYVHDHRYRVTGFADIFRADAPTAYFRLGDGRGATTMADASGNGNDGTYKNGQESGPFGISGDGDRARRFDGASGYGYANGLAAGRFGVTLEAWVKPRDPQRRQSIAGHGDAGELFVEDGTFKFRFMGATAVADRGPAANAFTQVVGVWDGVDLIVYVDGVERGRTSQTRRPSSSSTFFVGFGEVAPWFDGVIDEVALYAKALPAARVWQHWKADPPPPADSAEEERPSAGSTAGGGSAPAPTAAPGGSQGGSAPQPSTSSAKGASTSRASKPRAKKKRSTARARALAKCRKVKGAKKRAACVKRAKRLPNR